MSNKDGDNNSGNEKTNTTTNRKGNRIMKKYHERGFDIELLFNC